MSMFSEPEVYLTIKEARAMVPGRPDVSTLHRWSRKGVKARNGFTVKLATVRMGGQVFTTKEALSSFAKELRINDDAASLPPDDMKERADAAMKRMQLV